MSVPNEDNSCCVSEYSCSSTPHLNHPHALNHITNSNPPSHQGPLACRPESNECPPTNGGFSSGHLPFHHATSETNATTSTIASSSSSLSTINPGNATTSSTASLSPTPDHNADNQNHHLFYSSGSNCATYPSSHTESRINTDIVLSRPDSQDDANISEKTSIAQPLSVLPPSFQIKQENNLSPPTRSISVHSLPSSLISPYQLGVTSSTIALPGLDPFILSKREFIDDSELTRRDESDLSGLSYSGNNNSNIINNNMVSLSQNPHTMGYVTCSSFDPHRSAVLSQSHLIGTCLLPDSSSHMSLFSSHRATTLSPLPLTVAIGADSNTTQGPSGRIHRNPMNSTHSDVNSGVPMHLDSPSSTQHLNPFEVTGGESGFACLLPPTSSSATTVDSVNKRVNSHGNGMCMNPGPCDLSAPNVPIGLSPRSKARRYSYPYEPIGLSKSFTKDFQLPDQDRSSHSCLSPGLFRIIGSSNGNSTVNNNMGNVNNYHSVGLGSSSGGAGDCGLTSVGLNGSGGGGGRTLSTPMSSCGGEDVHQSGPLIGDHMHDQKPFMPSDDDVTLPGFSSPESAFYQYQHRMEGQRCQVCGELAAGFHHGAYVCEACKKFFMRHSLTDTKPTNVCPTGGNCVVAKGSRGKCQICRYRKCLYVGMKMKDPDSQPELDISNIPCRVCGGRSSGFHFGALTCEGCKGFFRRTEGSAGSLVCVGGQNACTITPRSRNACKSCRFRRCIAAGMSKKGSRIGRQPNAVKFHCAIEIRQLRSIRGNYSSHMDIHGGLPGTPGPTTSAGPSAYTPFSVDIGQTMDTVTNPGSLHNRSDVESPKYSPDTLTSTYANRRDPNVWVNDQKPPLSLLLFLPRTSDPIDVTSSCSNTSGPNTNVAIGDSIGGGGHRAIETGVYLGQDVIKPSQFSPPTSYHSTVLSGPPFDRFNLDTVCLRQSSSMALSADSAGFGGTQSCREAYLTKNEDDILGIADSSLRCGPADRLTSSEDDPHSVSHQHDPIKSLDAYPSPVSLALHSLLAPFGYLGRLNRATSTPDVTGNGHTLDEDNSCGLHNLESGSTGIEAIDDNQTSSSEPGPGAQTAELITDLAQRLAEEEQEGMAGDELEPDDGTGCPPSHEAVLRFIDGMRTATEFLRLPNTYFKTRFRMSTIPLDQYEKDVQVWSHMMNHFHMHAQQIVQFAKLVPGFNHLGITARSNLVRGAMYPVVLLLLSRDYRPDTDEFNYFDFTPDERATIMHHFPSYIRFTEHLRMAGRLLHHLGLSLPELSLLCAVEIVRNYQVLDEPTRSSTKELYILAHHSLRMYMTNNSDIGCDSDNQHRWAQLVAMSKMIQAMNREHHEILTNLKSLRPDLYFPELYVEMFRLADDASALVSASAKAVTLACSSAFQSLTPLRLSMSHTSTETSSTVSQLGHPDSGMDSTTVTSSMSTTATSTVFVPSLTEVGELGSTQGFLPTSDRWDAGRLALAVPAAMAAVAAVAAETSTLSQTVHQSQQHHQRHFPGIASGVYHQQQPNTQQESSCPGSATLLPRSDMLTGVAHPSQRHSTNASPYFTGSATSLFFTQTHPPAS